MDWFTVDGARSYEGMLCELISVLPHMSDGGIIYVVSDRLSLKNFVMRDVIDYVSVLFGENLEKHVEEVMTKEICYLVVKRKYNIVL